MHTAAPCSKRLFGASALHGFDGVCRASALRGSASSAVDVLGQGKTESLTSACASCHQECRWSDHANGVRPSCLPFTVSGAGAVVISFLLLEMARHTNLVSWEAGDA
eukprot:6530360-Lingulodinium_polyedra.AAC.2